MGLSGNDGKEACATGYLHFPSFSKVNGNNWVTHGNAQTYIFFCLVGC
jgi:hypothetical protein